MKLKLLSLRVVLGITALRAEAKRIRGHVFWVVETNEKTKNYSIIRFYDSQNEIVGMYHLDGVHLDIRKDKDIKKLKKLSYHLSKVETKG